MELFFAGKVIMSNITDYLKSIDRSLIEEPEVTNHDYSMFNDGSVEVEVGEFLYGLVRLLKPNNILETGTYKGVSSSYMAQALKDNGKGLLTTLEIEKEHIRISKERWHKLELDKYIVCDKEESLKYELEYDCELMFLDSEPYFRFQELRRFYSRLTPGGFVFIHDTPRDLCQGNVNPDHPEFKSWPFGDINKDVHDWVLDHDLVPFFFGSPRGMCGFYRKDKRDYNWGRI